MKVDFRKIKAENVDGTTVEISVSEQLGNQIYQMAMTEEEMNFGREIFKKGEVDLNKNRASIIEKILEKNIFVAFAKSAILKAMEGITDEEIKN